MDANLSLFEILVSLFAGLAVVGWVALLQRIDRLVALLEDREPVRREVPVTVSRDDKIAEIESRSLAGVFYPPDDHDVRVYREANSRPQLSAGE